MAKPVSPNILWLVAEDICPQLGCYGDPSARTPTIDRLAARGVRFDNVSSTGPICAPARSCLISGMYPPSLGSQHMRSAVERPDSIRCFTEYLRDAGYYCFNGMAIGEKTYQTKFDYNFALPTLDAPLPAWDATSGHFPEGKGAHWADRKDGQPFFGQVGFFITHSSQYGRRHLGDAECREFRCLSPGERHDPNAMRIPAYHPDNEGARMLWAEYYDCIEEMDYQVGEVLAELEQDGLTDDTIIFFFGDNGMGVPGGKSWLWEQGLDVPLVIVCPLKFRHLFPGIAGGVDHRMIGFEDFAPTVLTLAGVTVPDHMQGRAFCRSDAPNRVERHFTYGIRDRHDHAFDLIRTVRSRDFHYNRNFFPDTDWWQVFYMWRSAPKMMSEWRAEASAGSLVTRQQAFFARTKPAEELYDRHNDREQMHNLAGDPRYADVLRELRQECERWMVESGDLGLLSEFEMHRRADGAPPATIAHDQTLNPVRELLDAAWLANTAAAAEIPALRAGLASPDCAIRRWAALGFRALGTAAAPAQDVLRAGLQDESPDVAIACAGALYRAGYKGEAVDALSEVLNYPSGLVALTAMAALDEMGTDAAPALPALLALPSKPREHWLANPHIWDVLIDALVSRLDPTAPRRADAYRTMDLAAAREKFYP